MKTTDTARPAFRECGPLEQPPRDVPALCQLLLDQLPVGVFHKDREGRYVFVNSWFCRLYGATADEYLGRTALEVAAGKRAPDDAEPPNTLRTAKLFNEGARHHELIMRTGRRMEVEERHADADGKERYFHAIKGPLIGPDGTIIGSQGILLDITKRKQAEAQLAKEQDLLRALLNSSTDAVYFKDRQSRFLRCSAAMAPLFNLSSPDELIGKSDFDFQGEEHARRAFEDEQEIIRTGRPVIAKTEKEEWPDGRVTWALTSKMPMRNKAGEIVGTFGISKDITAIKEADEALHSQQELTQLIIDQAFDAVVTADIDFKVIGCNRQAEKTLGWTRADILGCNLLETVIPPGRREVRRKGLERFKATGEWADLNRLIETTAMTRDGRELPVELTITPIGFGKNSIFTIFIRDITERRQAEAALAHERHLLESLLENSLDSIYFKDRDSRFLRCSKSLSQRMPGGAADLIGKTDFDLFAEEHARPAFQDEQEIIRTGCPVIGKVEREVEKDGRESWALTSKMPLRDKAGQIVGTFGISKDITAIKEAEKALHSQQERTQLIIDQAFDAVITTDIDFKIIGWNRQAEETLGWTRAGILGCDLVETVVPPGRREVRRKDLARFKATGDWADLNRLFETTAMTRDGRELPVELTMTPIRCGENVIFTIFIRDITDRRQAEAALARERHLLESLLENSLDSIYFKDRDSRFLRCSKSLSQRMPGGAADLIGKTDFDLFAEEHARPAFQDEQEIIRSGCPLIGKVEREVAKDGRESWVLTSKMPLRDKAGQIVGTCGISKDITAIKQAEAELERAHKQLVQASRLAGMAEVATSVLHNVGNVLNSVNVSATLLLDNARQSKVSSLGKAVALLNAHAADAAAYLAQDPKGRQFPAYLNLLCQELTKEQQRSIAELESVRENVDHVKEIVAMQQNYARVSGVTETVKVTEIVEDAVRMNAGAMQRHEVALVRQYTDEPMLSIEKHKVLQILVNLIRNAKYACDESGRRDKQITLKIWKRDQWICIAVMDNGIGIPPENLTRVFNHGFTTRKDGHGFGLHSGALAARELGGSLSAYSEGRGFGAVFTLELPVQPPSRDKITIPQEQPGNDPATAGAIR